MTRNRTPDPAHGPDGSPLPTGEQARVTIPLPTVAELKTRLETVAVLPGGSAVGPVGLPTTQFTDEYVAQIGRLIDPSGLSAWVDARHDAFKLKTGRTVRVTTRAVMVALLLGVLDGRCLPKT